MGITIKGLGPDYDPGAGNQGERLQVMCVSRPTLVIATVSGGLTPTATGRRMHFVYCINAASRRPSSPKATITEDSEVEIRFDIGTHFLNHPGTLYLADGSPADTYHITIKSLECEKNKQWHWLTVGIPVGFGPSTYRIPDWHTKLRGTTETGLTTVQVGNVRGAVGQQKMTLPPDRILTLLPTNPMNIATGWRG